jgi:putative alpha-1,2-mannosidase
MMVAGPDCIASSVESGTLRAGFIPHHRSQKDGSSLELSDIPFDGPTGEWVWLARFTFASSLAIRMRLWMRAMLAYDPTDGVTTVRELTWNGCRILCLAGLLVWSADSSISALCQSAISVTSDPAALVNPLIGTTNGGNDYPGATLPLGMVAWSPEEPRNHPRRQVQGVPGSMRDDLGRPAAPGGYEYSSTRISGLSLTHLMGTSCAGASGDIPFMRYAGEITTSPAEDTGAEIYGSTFSRDHERAQAGYYKVELDNGVVAELTSTLRTGSGRFTYPQGRPAVMLVRTAYSETGSTDAHIRIDHKTRTISGSVTSGNFCGYIGTVDRRNYTLYFVAHFDTPFRSEGTWQSATVEPGNFRSPDIARFFG